VDVRCAAAVGGSGHSRHQRAQALQGIDKGARQVLGLNCPTGAAWEKLSDGLQEVCDSFHVDGLAAAAAACGAGQLDAKVLQQVEQILQVQLRLPIVA